MNTFLRQYLSSRIFVPGGGGGGLLGSISAGYVPLASPNPYPIIVYSVAIIDPILVTFEQMPFSLPQLREGTFFIGEGGSGYFRNFL